MADVGSTGGMKGSSTSGVPPLKRELPRRDVVTAPRVRDDSALVLATEPRRLGADVPGDEGLDGLEGLGDDGLDGLDGAEVAGRLRGPVGRVPRGSATASDRLPQTAQ